MPQGLGEGEKPSDTVKSSNSVLLALGSNKDSAAGSPAKTLCEALATLENRGAVIRAISSFYHTPAHPAGSGPDFVNAAAEIDVSWSASRTMQILHQIEADLGRRRMKRWGPRTLDLDLLAYGDAILPDGEVHEVWRNLPVADQGRLTPDRLVVPHPRMQDRAFVLVPLHDVAPDWRHPVLGRTVKEMYRALPEEAVLSVRRLGNST